MEKKYIKQNHAKIIKVKLADGGREIGGRQIG